MQEKKPLNVAIGRRIQQSRERAGLTQENLAERIERSTQFVSTIERGLAGPSLETVIKICEVLQVSTEWILRGRMAVPEANALAFALEDKFSSLSLRQLRLIGQLADDLLALIHASGGDSEELLSPRPEDPERP